MNVAYLMNNSEEIRKRLAERGYFMCSCCCFEDSKWLIGYNNGKDVKNIHGLGYRDEFENMTQSQKLDEFLAKNCRQDFPALCCGEDVELFIKTLEK